MWYKVWGSHSRRTNLRTKEKLGGTSGDARVRVKKDETFEQARGFQAGLFAANETFEKRAKKHCGGVTKSSEKNKKASSAGHGPFKGECSMKNAKPPGGPHDTTSRERLDQKGAAFPAQKNSPQ